LPGWRRDSRGVKIARWYKEALQYGAVTGPGIYYDHASANAIILGQHDDMFHLAVIKRKDVNANVDRIFVPGGMGT